MNRVGNGSQVGWDMILSKQHPIISYMWCYSMWLFCYCRYQELARTESLTALHYLQTSLSEIIDHEDQEQTREVGVTSLSKYNFMGWCAFINLSYIKYCGVQNLFFGNSSKNPFYPSLQHHWLHAQKICSACMCVYMQIFKRLNEFRFTFFSFVKFSFF